MKLFKKYIIENNFEELEKYKELIRIMTYDIADFLTKKEVDLLLKKNSNVEINSILLDYINRKIGSDIDTKRKNILDIYNLGDFEEENTENEDLGKKTM